LLGLLCGASPAVSEDATLRERIDRQMAASGDQPVCSDAEFLRRASLDLIGMPPTVDEVREFLADGAPDKRERLVDRMIASPQFARHLASTLDVMLMERRANTHVPQDDWYGWLVDCVRNGEPWNLIVREILTADGDNPAARGPARFFLDRESEPNLLTRDIGRIFFGRDFQCAQCHDHPLIDDYHQADYHGLMAFLAPGYAVIRKETVKEGDKETTKEVTLYAEKAGSDLTFESVFIQGTPHRTGPRIPGKVEIEEPFYYPGEEYEIAPADGVKSVPRFSRRAQLAALATDGSDRMFNENMANRLWAHMLGRGLVHPVDLHHYDNPPTDPELLKLLGEHLATTEFNLSRFLRELALTRAYQRPFDLTDALFSGSENPAVRVSELEQERAAVAAKGEASTAAFEEALEARAQAEAAMLPAAGELDKARTACAEAQKKLDEAQRELTKIQSELDLKQVGLAAVEPAAAAAQQAADALKDDAEIAAAAQKFAERSQQLKDAIGALVASVDEKTAALAAPVEALTTARKQVDSTLSDVTPLRQAVRQAEAALIEARQLRQQDATALAAIDQRLTTARDLAAIPDLQGTIEQNRMLVGVRRSGRESAVQALSDFAAVVSDRESALASATETLTGAGNALAAVQAELEKRQILASSVQAAAESARKARELLPDDIILADAAQKLTERAEALTGEMGELRTAADQASAAREAADNARGAAEQFLAEAQQEQTRLAEAVAAADALIVQAETEVTASQAKYDLAVAQLTDRWTADFSLASLKPLTPEQLCWSIFRVTGVYQRYWDAEAAELAKSNPLTEEQQQDEAQVQARVQEIEQRTYDKLKGNVGTFVRFYGAAAGQPQGDFFATADQALFAANGDSINSWVAPAGGNVSEQIINALDSKAGAEALYLTVLNRLPTEQEVSDVSEYLAARPDNRATAAQELVWGLLNSIEFRFNH
ncbi:MAG: DUF1549 domain-containing protein, partial [Planctomycetaceae bacterium]|nr:DUF1549 domain-containing protein [Planctomycetaceae bacterium]